MSRVIIYKTAGLHCASCERLVGNVLKDVAGVEEVEVSVKQQRAAIRLNDAAKEPDLVLLNQQLAGYGYHISTEEKQEVCRVGGKRDGFWRRLGRALAALAGISLVLAVIGSARSFVPEVSAGASFGALFALGLVASVSTCLTSTGGFLLAYTSKSSSKMTSVAVHLGRLAAFVFGGLVLGAIGGSLPQESVGWYGLLALILGVGFLVVGLSLLELSPSWARLGIALPSRLNALGDRVSRSQSGIAPFLVGAVTFILPCGFTQTAQALALASGSAQQGLLFMAAFALGTLPVLLGLTLFGSAAALRSRLLRLGAGAALVVFGFGQIDGGLTVLGAPWTPSTLTNAFSTRVGRAVMPAAQAQEQVVKMTVAYGTYSPKKLSIKKGIPVRWEIDGKDISGCANSIVAPTIGVNQSLTRGINVIRFTPKQAGTIPFSCSMGMIRGSFTVTE